MSWWGVTVQISVLSAQRSEELVSSISSAVFELVHAFWTFARWLVLGLSRTVPRNWRGLLTEAQAACRRHVRHPRLREDETFWTTAVVPGAFGDDRRSAIERQLSQLSPLPTDEIAFAYGGSLASTLGTKTMHVCLVRRSVLSRAGSPVVVARRGDDRAHFVSDRYIKMVGSGLAQSRWVIAFCILLGLFLGAAIYSARLSAHNTVQQQLLTQDIRQLRVETSSLQTVTADYPTFGAPALLSYLNDQAASSNLVLLNLHISHQRHEAVGFLRSTAKPPTDISVQQTPGTPRGDVFRPVRLVSQPNDG